jgi:hypothetical protein
MLTAIPVTPKPAPTRREAPRCDNPPQIGDNNRHLPPVDAAFANGPHKASPTPDADLRRREERHDRLIDWAGGALWLVALSAVAVWLLAVPL